MDNRVKKILINVFLFLIGLTVVWIFTEHSLNIQEGYIAYMLNNIKAIVPWILIATIFIVFSIIMIKNSGGTLASLVGVACIVMAVYSIEYVFDAVSQTNGRFQNLIHPYTVVLESPEMVKVDGEREEIYDGKQTIMRDRPEQFYLQGVNTKTNDRMQFSINKDRYEDDEKRMFGTETVTVKYIPDTEYPLSIKYGENAFDKGEVVWDGGRRYTRENRWKHKSSAKKYEFDEGRIPVWKDGKRFVREDRIMVEDKDTYFGEVIWVNGERYIIG